MVNNAKEYQPSIFEDTVVGRAQGVAAAGSAIFGQRVLPVYETIMQTVRHGIQREAGYSPFNDDQTEGYEQYATTWGRATSPSHMAAILQTIKDSNERRQVMADASTGTLLAGSLYDPINLIAIPFMGGAPTFLGSAVRGGVGVATVEAGAEVVAQGFDATQTATESALNISTAFLFGGALTGAMATPRVMRARIAQRTETSVREEIATANRVQKLEELTPEDIASAPPRSERNLGATPLQELEAIVLNADRAAAASGQASSPEAASSVRAARVEIGLREFEALDVDIADPFRILPTVFTESVFFRAVTTPFKRALQSDAPSAVKETFVRSFSDSGMALALNSVFIKTPNSVHQLTAIGHGRWVQASDSLMKIWASETNASLTSRADVNFTDAARRLSRSPDTYRGWLRSVNEKRLRREELTEGEISAVSVINDYFRGAESRLEDVGLISNRVGLERKITLLEAEVEGLNARLSEIGAGKSANDLKARGLIELRTGRLNGQLKLTRRDLGLLSEAVSLRVDKSIEDFFPRLWDQSAIRRNRDEFSDVLYGHYRDNPFINKVDIETGKLTRVKLSTEPEKIQARVDETIAKILGEADLGDVDLMSFGSGRSNLFGSRDIDIPNGLVTEFMVTDPLAAMMTYSTRVDARYEYARMFGKDVDGVVLDIELDMLAAGKSKLEIDAIHRDYLHMYDRVAGVVIKNPDALSQKIGRFLRDGASFAYMGSAGFSAIPDFARIVMEYDVENIARGMQTMMDRETVGLAVDEVRKAGEVLDIMKGSSHMRVTEDLSNNIGENGIMDTARNAFYMLNGLSPLTSLAKQFAGIVDSHTIIEYSIKLRDGTLDAQSRTWLARHGIDEDLARRIARAPWQKNDSGLILANTDQWAGSIFIPEIDGKRVNVIETNPDGTSVGYMSKGRYVSAFYRRGDNTIRFDREYIEGSMFESKAWLSPSVGGVNALPDIFKTPRQWSNFVMLHEINHSRFSAEDLGFTRAQKAEYENAINDLALKDYREAQTLNQETVESFRVALNSGVINTIMAGTPADKPIITDGVVYIPMRVASLFGMVEDVRVKGYARIENGFMGLPFQFYSYTLANVNKTVGAMATGQVKNRALGVATMLGLGYWSLKLKTPESVWDEMGWRDRFARAFDQSGVAALYSDLFYTAMHTSLALGGPNITGGFISPKFPQAPSASDAVLGLAGAGPSWAQSMSEGAYQLVSGEMSEGAISIARNMPFARMWFWKDEMNQITRAWAN